MSQSTHLSCPSAGNSPDPSERPSRSPELSSQSDTASETAEACANCRSLNASPETTEVRDPLSVASASQDDRLSTTHEDEDIDMPSVHSASSDGNGSSGLDSSESTDGRPDAQALRLMLTLARVVRDRCDIMDIEHHQIVASMGLLSRRIREDIANSGVSAEALARVEVFANAVSHMIPEIAANAKLSAEAIVRVEALAALISHRVVGMEARLNTSVTQDLHSIQQDLKALLDQLNWVSTGVTILRHDEGELPVIRQDLQTLMEQVNRVDTGVAKLRQDERDRPAARQDLQALMEQMNRVETGVVYLRESDRRRYQVASFMQQSLLQGIRDRGVFLSLLGGFIVYLIVLGLARLWSDVMELVYLTLRLTFNFAYALLQ